MKKLAVLVLVAALTPAIGAKVWTTVYRCDEKTLLAPVDPNHPDVFRDIMVGTRLVIVIGSDTKGSWSGALLSSWQDWDYGELTGRGYNEKTRNYDGSCLAPAGGNPSIRFYQNPDRVGFQFYVRLTAVPGNWFIIDYLARKPGFCAVVLLGAFDVPIETLHFVHVPSRDFNGDGLVDFKDFALLASHWNSAVDPDPNSPDRVFDLNADARIDAADLALFSEYWLDQADCHKPAAEPNNPSPGL